MAVKGTIVKVSGPLIVASGMADVNMYDVVRVSEKHDNTVYRRSHNNRTYRP